MRLVINIMLAWVLWAIALTGLAMAFLIVDNVNDSFRFNCE